MKTNLLFVCAIVVSLPTVIAFAESIPQGVIVKAFNKVERQCEIDQTKSLVFARSGLPSVITKNRGSWQTSNVEDLSEVGNIRLRISAVESSTQELKIVDLVISANETRLNVLKNDPNIGNRNIQITSDKLCADENSTAPLLVNSIEYSVVQ